MLDAARNGLFPSAFAVPYHRLRVIPDPSDSGVSGVTLSRLSRRSRRLRLSIVVQDVRGSLGLIATPFLAIRLELKFAFFYAVFRICDVGRSSFVMWLLSGS